MSLKGHCTYSARVNWEFPFLLIYCHSFQAWVFQKTGRCKTKPRGLGYDSASNPIPVSWHRTTGNNTAKLFPRNQQLFLWQITGALFETLFERYRSIGVCLLFTQTFWALYFLSMIIFTIDNLLFEIRINSKPIKAF